MLLEVLCLKKKNSKVAFPWHALKILINTKTCGTKNKRIYHFENSRRRDFGAFSSFCKRWHRLKFQKSTAENERRFLTRYVYVTIGRHGKNKISQNFLEDIRNTIIWKALFVFPDRSSFSRCTTVVYAYIWMPIAISTIAWPLNLKIAYSYNQLIWSGNFYEMYILTYSSYRLIVWTRSWVSRKKWSGYEA